MAAITNEKGVKAAVKKLLDKHDYFWWMPPANGYGRVGISDFHAIKNGVFISIETKFGYNKPTEPQKAFCQSIMSQKGFAFVVNEKNLDWLERWLECFDNATSAVMHGGTKSPDEVIAVEDGAAMLDAIRALTELL